MAYGFQPDGYDTYGAGFFKVQDSQFVLHWKSYHVPSLSNVPIVNKGLEGDISSPVVAYQLKEIPRAFKRSAYDHARLLIVALEDGSLLAKRHNNNQKLSIR